MLRQNPPRINPERHGPDRNYRAPIEESEGLDLQRHLQRLEEIIVLDSFKLPLTGRTLVDEEQLLSQLLRVERSIPETVQIAERILRNKEEIIAHAQDFAQEIIKAAEQRAAQIADEVRIVRQAEMEAQQIRQKVQEEIEAIRQRNYTELERVRRQTQQEIEEMQRVALAERDQIQAGADTYADRVLTDLEGQLSEMLRVIRNGRQHLHEAPGQRSPSS